MRRSYYDPGALNHRIALSAPTETPDGCGGVDVEWNEQAEVWASLQPLSATRPDQAQQIQEQSNHKVVIRFRTDVASGWRVIVGNRILEILNVTDPDERRAYLVLTTQEDGR